jgi:hypothetical protein
MKIPFAFFPATLLCCVLSSCWAQTPTPAKASAGSGEEGLAQQAADPTAPLMAFNMKEEYYPSFYGYRGSGNDFVVQPVIPFMAWGQANLLRATVNYNINGPGGSALNNVSVFDLLVFNEKWGRWGFGPLVQFASSQGPGTDTALAGPAVGFVARKGKWNLGLFNQNLFGSYTRFSSLQPIIAYVLGRGWTLASGDAQWSVNWRKPQVVYMPVGVQLAKVQRLGKQPVRFLFNPEYNARNYTGAPHWSLRFGFTILAPSR